MGVRVEKIQEQIKQEVSAIILRELKDPRIGFVTVTKVDVSSDLGNAKIYVSILGNKKQFADTWEGLRHSVGYIRQELAKRIRIRFIPEIAFYPDTTIQYSAHIQELINEIHHAGEGKPEDENNN
ncbi:30S ribosome-binding factor RbfA [Pectinatus cerevisiiphilus]|uniref:Ribosome-binding factor A n=1 Tax=Pectinatus cerevisiiphilus TaxID=86956 RepID=A0A4V2URY4_9FIRM|nr:30S ribosome-binding factor RbfA [Pectinatus cerevisiiphilus]TCS79242.1 ribosome-binding factor A [Pectinatus cerevisiiphilus]